MIAAGIALSAVWFSNGLWHGAGWNYLFFGVYHFAWILLENITEPFVVGFTEKHGIDREARWYVVMQIIRTTLLVNIGELFFRAEGLRAGMKMFGIMVSDFTLRSFFDGTILTLGMDAQDFLITLVALVLVLSIHLLWEKGTDLRDLLARQKTPVRWAVYYGFLFFIILFGAYGVGYLPVDPIYAAF
jgi:D-alanyl-lipoteichoic acid acyltransferase DltB (MBOAT superfamily)